MVWDRQILYKNDLYKILSSFNQNIKVSQQKTIKEINNGRKARRKPRPKQNV